MPATATATSAGVTVPALITVCGLTRAQPDSKEKDDELHADTTVQRACLEGPAFRPAFGGCGYEGQPEGRPFWLALQRTTSVLVVVSDPHASNQSMPSLTRSNFSV